MSAEPNWRGVERKGILGDVAPHQPLTREQCEALAIGSAVCSPFLSASERAVATALRQMFGGIK